MPHTVLKVGRLFSNEVWIIDTAGCQYGFQEALVPFQKYIADRSCKMLHDPITYDASETKDLDCFSTLPFMNKTKAQREDRRLERKARLRFADFVNMHVDTDILNGSPAEYKDKSDKFLQDLKLHMSSEN